MLVLLPFGCDAGSCAAAATCAASPSESSAPSASNLFLTASVGAHVGRAPRLAGLGTSGAPCWPGWVSGPVNVWRMSRVAGREDTFDWMNARVAGWVRREGRGSDRWEAGQSLLVAPCFSLDESRRMSRLSGVLVTNGSSVPRAAALPFTS